MDKYESDGLFVCYSCKKILGYILNDKKIYLANRIEQHNKYITCKQCKAIQWGDNKKGSDD